MCLDGYIESYESEAPFMLELFLLTFNKTVPATAK
jgi:hypothetical protein